MSKEDYIELKKNVDEHARIIKLGYEKTKATIGLSEMCCRVNKIWERKNHQGQLLNSLLRDFYLVSLFFIALRITTKSKHHRGMHCALL